MILWLRDVLKFNTANTGAWCNGSTPAFEAVDLGSTPSAPAFNLVLGLFLQASCENNKRKNYSRPHKRIAKPAIPITEN